MSLTFESPRNSEVTLGSLASRTQCKPMTKEGVSPYTMWGTDSRSGAQYSFSTDRDYGYVWGTYPQQMNEGKEIGKSSIDYTSASNQTFGGRSGVLKLSSSGSILSAWGNTCGGRGVFGSNFGPDVYTQAFSASAGQSLSFNWAASGGGDDYEIYAFLVKVSPSGASYDYGGSGSTLLANTTVLAHGRGKDASWTTSTGTIPTDGYYRFRFVNGTYDASGGWGVGAVMYIDSNVLVGEPNNITFAALSDRVTSSSNQTFSISATNTAGTIVNFTSLTTSRCTVGSSTLANGISTATVTVLANQLNLCSISANSPATGEYATAATVTRSFTIQAAPTAPTNSGGTVVSGTAAVGQTLTAVDGSWADGGSEILETTYQWQSCAPASCSWSNVSGATESSFLVGTSDVGKQLRVRVTKRNSIGSTTVDSSASSTVVKGSQAALSISTTTMVYGSSLTLETTGGSGSGAVTYTKISGDCTLSNGVVTPGNAGSSCVIKATKAADAAYNLIDSSNTSITTDKASQAAVTVTSTSGTFGSTVALTSAGGSGTGETSWQVVSGPCSVSGSTLTPSGAGDCVVRATRASDTNYLSRSSADTTVSIAKGSQPAAVSVTTSSATYGDSVTLAASGGNGTGAYSFARVSGPCTVSGNTMTSSSVGTCVVTATRESDDDYLAATSANASIAIGRKQLSFTVTAADRAYDGTVDADLTLSALSGKVSGDDVSLDRGKIRGEFSSADPGTNKLVTLTIASGLLTGADANNYTYATPANPRADISKGSQTGFGFTNAATFTAGTTLQLQSSGGQSGGPVSFSVVSGDCALSGTQLSASKGGIRCVVSATRQGDSRYNNTTATLTVTVNKAPQQLSFRSTAPSPAIVGSTYTVSVVSDVFLAPTVAVANASSSVCSIAAEVVTFLSVGTCVLSANQAGSDTYSAAAASQSITVVAAPVSTSAGTATDSSVPVTSSSIANRSTATTIPRTNNSATPAPTTTAATTTTTVPSNNATNQADPTKPMTDAAGNLPELDGGATSAMVRGERVETKVTVNEQGVTVELPNEVTVGVAATDSSGAPLPVDADGTVSSYRGGIIRVRLSGLVPGTTYTAFMFSEPVELGRGIVGPDGTVDEEFPIPKSIAAGGHTLQVNGVGEGSEVVSVAMGIELLEKQDLTALTVSVIVLAILGALFIPLRRRRRRNGAFL